MYYINSTPNDNGNYGNPRSSGGGYVLPDSLLDSYIATQGFAVLTLDGDIVTAVEVNQEALDAYLAEHPVVPPTPAEPSAEELINILLGGADDE